jgi:uncharacterized protein
MLHLTDRCNIDCKYCYAGKSGRTMTPETARKAVDFFKKHAGDAPHTLIDFIGGEPLMAGDILRQTVDYARSQGIVKFGVSTNGTPLDKRWMEYLAENRFALHMSVDGIGEEHDKNRPYVGGGGSFKRLDEVLDELGPYGPGLMHFEVRYTFTPDNTKNLAETIRYFASKPIMKYGWVIVMPAMLPSGSWDAMLRDGSLMPLLREQFKSISDLCIERMAGGQSLHICYNDCLESSPSLSLWETLTEDSCRPGEEFVTVNMDGDIYPCHLPGSHPGSRQNSAYKIGHVDSGITRTEAIRSFTGGANSKCHSCHHWNRLEHGDPADPAAVYKALYVAWLEAGRRIRDFRRQKGLLGQEGAAAGLVEVGGGGPSALPTAGRPWWYERPWREQ